MDRLEKQIDVWVAEMWHHADRVDSPREWTKVRECMYGALQASNWAGAMEQYDAFSTLADVAHWRVMMAYDEQQKEAA